MSGRVEVQRRVNQGLLGTKLEGGRLWKSQFPLLRVKAFKALGRFPEGKEVETILILDYPAYGGFL